MRRDDARAFASFDRVLGVAHFVHVNRQRSQHNYQSTCEHAPDQLSSQDASMFLSWRSVHDAWIYRLHAQRLRGWAIHENICSMNC